MPPTPLPHLFHAFRMQPHCIPFDPTYCMCMTNTNTTTAATTTELHNGIDGSGNATFLVVTVRDGNWAHVERFDNEAEARNWMRWA